MVFYLIYLFLWFLMYGSLGGEISFFGLCIVPNMILGVVVFIVAHWASISPDQLEEMIERKEEQEKQKYDGYIHGVRKVTWFTKRRFK